MTTPETGEKTGQPRIIPPLYTTAPSQAEKQPPLGVPLLRWDMREEANPDRTRTRKNSTPPAAILPASAHPPQDLPDPLVWSRNLSRVIFDVLGGRRDVATIRRWLDPRLYRRLQARIESNPVPTQQSLPARVRRAKIWAVSDTAVEASAVVEEKGRCRAIAMRLEVFRGRWKMTALEMG